MSPEEDFQISCTTNGSFYVCEDAKTRFLGCCDIDPCADGSGSCEFADLWQIEWGGSDYSDTVPAQNCKAPLTEDDWYACDDSSFMGCCSSNPCFDGDDSNTSTSAQNLPSSNFMGPSPIYNGRVSTVSELSGYAISPDSPHPLSQQRYPDVSPISELEGSTYLREYHELDSAISSQMPHHINR
ncbi:uncharacterized protein F4822DRAFT_423619 [Hypoxylon trugodes]|uniref:uncharacterized protein n=1 Tax=Hypoxylon trugodes TaxID=326681 RepID=UPI0021A1F60E|nr:uncharacterized protein F4822DRAFT_423619 [Hypoxylon trugodes]KAI1393155.1 hypothetical protein F4822DRAFT_423619 [Hypoxylon trugodes]